jgi:hypothetical protein
MQCSPLSWFWLLLLLSGTSGEVSAEVATLSTSPQGIRTLGVEISGIQQGYRRYGLDAAKLRTRVIQQLEEAGFKIVPTEDNGISPPDALLQININLVLCHSLIDGYNFRNLMRASSVVNCQWTVACRALRSASQAVTSRVSAASPGMRRSRHC